MAAWLDFGAAATATVGCLDAPGVLTEYWTLWVPNILSPYATWAYSCIRPPSRSRRRIRTFGSVVGG